MQALLAALSVKYRAQWSAAAAASHCDVNHVQVHP